MEKIKTTYNKIMDFIVPPENQLQDKPANVLPLAPQGMLARRESELRPADSLEEKQESKAKQEVEYKDCMECRVVGTVTSLGVVGYVAYIAQKNPKAYTGRKKVFFQLQAAALCTGFGVMAVMRAFDLGLFSDENKDKTIQEILKNDFVDIKDAITQQKNTDKKNDCS